MDLAPAPFAELPPGAVQPTGWLRRQLWLQAIGITGHLGEIWPDVGPNSAWLGGTGEDWERGPYYLDGLIGLAYVLRDERLIALAQRWSSPCWPAGARTASSGRPRGPTGGRGCRCSKRCSSTSLPPTTSGCWSSCSPTLATSGRDLRPNRSNAGPTCGAATR